MSQESLPFESQNLRGNCHGSFAESGFPIIAPFPLANENTTHYIYTYIRVLHTMIYRQEHSSYVSRLCFISKQHKNRHTQTLCLFPKQASAVLDSIRSSSVQLRIIHP